MKSKTKTVVFRVEPEVYNFLKEFGMSQNPPISLSETIRKMINYFFMGVLTGEIKMSFSQLKKEYLKRKAFNRKK